MDVIQVPAAALSQPRIDAGPISFISYSDKGGPFRNRVMFNQYAFSFVQNGQKHIYRTGGHALLQAGHGMLIPAGHSLIAEHTNNKEPYQSLIIFFPGELGRDFLSQQLPLLRRKKQEMSPPYIHFEANGYLLAYVLNIRHLIETGAHLSESVALHKLNELLLIMAELYPDQLAGMFAADSGLQLKVLVEQHLFSKLSLEELAFLANRSLSSFKRDFEKLYGISPQRHIRDRKLELASAELALGENPGDLYLKYGYENLSNFNTAFKRRYGRSPAKWRNELLSTVS